MKMKATKEINIVPVEKSNSFMGLKFENNSINLYVPQFFRTEKNWKSDVLLFLKSLSLANTFEKKKLNNGDSNNLIWPIDSYLWIIKDYIENGFYYNREKKYSNSNSGKLEWKRIFKQVPIYSDGNIIYDKVISSAMSASNDIVAQIYKLCLKQSINRIGWLFDFNFNVQINQVISKNEMRYIIRNELNETFDDIKRLRYRHMLKIIANTEGDNLLSNQFSYGITNYYYVFETMVDYLFDGIKGNEKKKYNPNGYWQLNNVDSFKASVLRPDTVLKRNASTYILDAKMYQYGATHNINDLPDTQSMQKQITYGDFIFNSIGDKKVRNAFILPYNKELESFKENVNIIKYNDGNLAYLGYAFVDWRETNRKDYDYIHTYCIDYNYLLNNYNHKDENLIQNLCDSIEKSIE